MLGGSTTRRGSLLTKRRKEENEGGQLERVWLTQLLRRRARLMQRVHFKVSSFSHFLMSAVCRYRHNSKCASSYVQSYPVYPYLGYPKP